MDKIYCKKQCLRFDIDFVEGYVYKYRKVGFGYDIFYGNNNLEFGIFDITNFNKYFESIIERRKRIINELV